MLEKLEITAYEDEQFTARADLSAVESKLNFPVNPLRVPINPDKYDRSLFVEYDDQKGIGSAGGSPLFHKYGGETVTFELVFDATGVLPALPKDMVPATSNGVADQIQALRAVTCDYDGEIHSPRFLMLAWGTLLFKCRLESLDLSYTLFKPNGMPLRARANATFTGFTDEAELAKKIKRSSPDLTRIVTVKAGDTLPLLCNRVYGSSGYYIQVAAANGLTSFRDLAPGTELIFPPLAGPA